MIVHRLGLVTGFLFVLSAVAPVRAAVIAYQDPADVGNQQWTGSLGEDFTVNSPIIVDALAVYDSGQDGIIGLLTVAIFDSSGAQVTPTATFTGTTGFYSGGDLFQNIAPVTLGPGNYSLTVAGWGPNAPNLNGNANCVGSPCPPAAAVRIRLRP